MLMPFGLKNAGVTYQRMVTHMFTELIGKTWRSIYDMVVKTKERVGHACNLVDVFDILRQHRLRLNAEKFAFGLGSSKFLRYMITLRGIKVIPNQIMAI